jgi:hypothetical protein
MGMEGSLASDGAAAIAPESAGRIAEGASGFDDAPPTGEAAVPAWAGDNGTGGGGLLSWSRTAKMPTINPLRAQAGPACSFIPLGSRVNVKLRIQGVVSYYIDLIV